MLLASTSTWIILLITFIGFGQFGAGDGMIETRTAPGRIGQRQRARLLVYQNLEPGPQRERSSSFVALPGNGVSVTAANSTITLQRLPLAENQDIHHLLKNFTVEYFASIRRAEEAAKTTPAPPTAHNCSREVTPGYRKKIVPINVQFWNRVQDRSSRVPDLRLKLVHQEWIHGAIYLPEHAHAHGHGQKKQNPPSSSSSPPMRAAPTSFLSEATQVSVSKVVEKMLQFQLERQNQIQPPQHLHGTNVTLTAAGDSRDPEFPLSLREAHAMWRDHNSYFLLVELNFFQVRLRSGGGAYDVDNGNATISFIPDTQTANLLRKPNCFEPDTKTNANTKTSSSGSIFLKQDTESGITPDSPHPRIFKLIKKIKKKIKKKKKKGKKKKKDKDHSSEEHHGPDFGYHGPPQPPEPIQQHFNQPQPQSGGWGQYGIRGGGAAIGGHEVAGWLGLGSGSGAGWGQDQGWYELEFLPAEILQKIATTLGMVAIVIGPILMVAAISWLVINALTGNGYKSTAAPAYIFNGRSHGSSGHGHGWPVSVPDYSIALLSYDDSEKYHTLEKIAR